MAAEELFCKFHQYGHCKFGSMCRKFHTKETCNTFKCITKDCSYRHPRQCKFIVLYGRCKFGTDCSFSHIPPEDEETKVIKTVEKEVSYLKSEILSLKTFNLELQSSLNAIKDILKANKKVNINETEQNVVPLFSCEFCDHEFITEEILKKHLSSFHETNVEVQQENFKCDLCDYESKSKKGVKIHRGSKHKSAPKSTSSTLPLLQTPLNCILKDDGCPNILNAYFNKYTAICQDILEKKLKSSPFCPELCPCCHQKTDGLQYSLCSECLESIQEDGYSESTWGSWHLDRI